MVSHCLLFELFCLVNTIKCSLEYLGFYLLVEWMIFQTTTILLIYVRNKVSILYKSE